jgi:hypothetical protein
MPEKSEPPCPPRMYECILRGFAPLREKKIGGLLVRQSEKQKAKSEPSCPPRMHELPSKTKAKSEERTVMSATNARIVLENQSIKRRANRHVRHECTNCPRKPKQKAKSERQCLPRMHECNLCAFASLREKKYGSWPKRERRANCEERTAMSATNARIVLERQYNSQKATFFHH